LDKILRASEEGERLQQTTWPVGRKKKKKKKRRGNSPVIPAADGEEGKGRVQNMRGNSQPEGGAAFWLEKKKNCMSDVKGKRRSFTFLGAENELRA